MIDDNNIKKSKENIQLFKENNFRKIYKEAINERKRVQKRNKKIITLISPIILFFAIFFIIYFIDTPNEVESTNWNNIEYVSDKKYKLGSAMIQADNSNIIGSEENVNLEFSFDEHIDTINVTDNITLEYWSTDNEDIKNKLISLVNLSYKQLDILKYDYSDIKYIFESGYSLSFSVQNRLTLNIIALPNGDVVIYDDLYFVSQSKINYKDFLKILEKIKENNNNYVPEIPSYNLNEIILNDSDVMSNIIGYENLDFNDYSTEIRNYYKNFKVTVTFNYSNVLLITNRVTGQVFIPNTNISFTSPKEYYIYLCEQYNFYQFEHVEKKNASNIFSFEIGDLTEEKEEWLLKLLKTKEVYSIKIENNHYYEKINTGNYYILQGYVNNDLNYLIIDSYEKLLNACVVHEIDTFDSTGLYRYDESFFENKFLYCFEIDYPASYGEYLQIDIIQNGKDIQYEFINTTPTLGSSSYGYIVFLEIDIINDSIDTEYKINGQSMIPSEVTLTLKTEDQEYTIIYRKGEIVYKSVINNKFFSRERLEGFSYDNTFINIFGDFVIEEDITVYPLTYKFSASYFDTGVTKRCLFVINVDDPTKNTTVSFAKNDYITKETLQEKLGYNIDKAYLDFEFKEEYKYKTVNGFNSDIIWVTETSKEEATRQYYNIKGTTQTFGEDGSLYGVNNISSSYNSLNSSNPPKAYTNSLVYSDYYNVTGVSLKNYNENSLYFKIDRHAFNESCLIADYELKYIAFYNDDVIIVLQRTYPLYLQFPFEDYRCIDFVEISNAKNIINLLKNKNIYVSVDDTFIDDDWYGNMEINDIEFIEFDKDIYYQNYEHYQYNEWYDITTYYEENHEKFIFQDDEFNLKLDDFANIGLLDLEKIDENLLNDILPIRFDRDNYSVLIVDRYSYHQNKHIAAYWFRPNYNSTTVVDVTIYGLKTLESATIVPDQMIKTHFVEMVIVENKVLEKIKKYNYMEIELSIVSMNIGVRTASFMTGGNNYDINELFYSYKSNYKLYDLETYTLLPEGDKVINKSYYDKVCRLLGYFPNAINSFSYSDPRIYIERTAYTNNQVKAIYDFISYDAKNNVLTLSRKYEETIEDNDFTPTVCYDVVVVNQLTTGFDIYKDNSNFELIIIDN